RAGHAEEGAGVRVRHEQQVPVEDVQRLLDARQRLHRARAVRRPARPDPAPVLAARHRGGEARRPAGHRLPAHEAVRDLAAAGDGRRPPGRHPGRVVRAHARVRQRGALPRPGLHGDGQQARGAGREVAGRGPAAGVRRRQGGHRHRRRPLPRPDHPDRPAQLAAEAGGLMSAVPGAIPVEAGVPVVPVRPGTGGRAALAAAIAATPGDAVLLLGEGVVPAPGAVAAMRALLEAQPRAGAVGLRLLAPDGRVRQAGGVVWSDGSRCSYGAGWNADDPRLLYLRTVDYCSGRALLVRREALEAAGWPGAEVVALDWADVELGFALRAAGWEVLYCPRATAVDGGGRVDLHDDVRGDIVGERAFRERWAEALAAQLAPCTRMSRARERSAGRPMALVVDHYLPRVDRDAGSRAIVQAMDALRGLGWQVKFWPANGAHGPHAAALEDVGIEVVCGEHWEGRVERMVRVAGAEFDAVVLSRPEQAEAAMALFRAHSGARLLYYAH